MVNRQKRIAPAPKTDKDLFAVGSVVKLVGLVNASYRNGRLGIVLRYVEDQDRWEVRPTQGKGTLAIKAENLTKEGIIAPGCADFSKHRRAFQHAVFWPRPAAQGTIPVHAFEDWPKEWRDENQYLKNVLQWEKPAVVGGVTSAGNAKPDFMMYFDGNDTKSPVNILGETIKSLLPDFELDKTPECKNTIRGACVLIYSPMKISTFSGGFGEGVGGMFPPRGPPITSGNAGRLFSLQQLRIVLEFHETRDAMLQYKRHNNPMHRVFGATM